MLSTASLAPISFYHLRWCHLVSTKDTIKRNWKENINIALKDRKGRKGCHLFVKYSINFFHWPLQIKLNDDIFKFIALTTNISDLSSKLDILFSFIFQLKKKKKFTESRKNTEQSREGFIRRLLKWNKINV